MSGAKTPLKYFDLSSFRYDPLRRETKGTNIPATRTRLEREDGELDVNAGALAKFQSSQPTTVPVVSDPIIYPISPSHRSTYLHPTTHKPLSTHQWAVYDLTLQIPIGKITTYKEIALALGSGSPRSVGSALRNNPFAPYVPCHRVVASNMFVGGFFGEWTDLKGKASNRRGEVGVKEEGEEMKRVEEQGQALEAGIERNWHLKVKSKGSGMVQREKIRLLGAEGVPFSEEGKLMGGKEFVWRFPKTQGPRSEDYT